MRNELALALKECDLTQVESGLNKVQKYSFFDSENEREAKDLLEGTLHAVCSKEMKQAVIQADELNKVLSYDRALNVINLLREIEIPAKPFCFHDRLKGDDNIPFRVKSRLLNWDITTMRKTSEKVPVVFMRALTYLKLKGVKISGIAIATPAEQSAKEIMEEVFHQEFKRARKTGEKGLTALTHAMGRVAEYTSLVYRNYVRIKDPILLIRVGQFCVEAGRWI